MSSQTLTNQIYRADVIAAQRLTPGMVRVTFGGDGLSDFATTGVGDESCGCSSPTVRTGAT
jgi:NADPH-dependent ferric siderophore reductase